MGNSHQTRFYGVLEMVVTSLGANELPTISFNHFYEFFTVHSPLFVYMNVYRQRCKINKKRLLSEVESSGEVCKG